MDNRRQPRNFPLSIVPKIPASSFPLCVRGGVLFRKSEIEKNIYMGWQQKREEFLHPNKECLWQRRMIFPIKMDGYLLYTLLYVLMSTDNVSSPKKNRNVATLCLLFKELWRNPPLVGKEIKRGKFNPAYRIGAKPERTISPAAAVPRITSSTWWTRQSENEEKGGEFVIGLFFLVWVKNWNWIVVYTPTDVYGFFLSSRRSHSKWRPGN